MSRLLGARVTRIAGWVGGVQENTEPAFGKPNGLAAIRRGTNAWHEDQQLVRRGGTREAAAYALEDLNDTVGVIPFSQVGLVAIAHSVDSATHRVIAHAPDGAFILPTRETATEATSSEPLSVGWDTATPGVPNGDELFEALYVADDSPIATRRPLQKIALSAGALAVSLPLSELGAGPAAPLFPAGAFVFNSHLFIFGYGSEDNLDEPHTMRHSYLGRDPGALDGFDPLAYATIGAQGQPIRAGARGQGVALVAKEAELYRITGSGAALPGWQFAVQQVSSSLAAGCANARCLVFAENAWYGLGRNGPWRCDGQSVEVLREQRDTSWNGVGDLSAAFVVYHPRRRAVLFFLPESASSLEGEGATVCWTWDLSLNRWAPDQRPAQRVRHAAAVAPSGVVVNTAPSNVAQVLTAGAFRETSAQLRWTIGLANQATEVWLASPTAGAQLVATVDAGITGLVLTGLTAGTAYTVTVRHVGAIVTPFSSGVTMYTRPPALRLVAAYSGIDGANFAYRVTVPQANRRVNVETLNATENAFSDTLTALASGVTQRTKTSAPVTAEVDTVRDPLLLVGYLEIADRPEAVAFSVDAIAACRVVSSVAAAPIPHQAVDAAAWSESAITVLVAPWTGVVSTLEVQYRKLGAVDWITADARTNGSASPPYAVTITGLESGERYEVRTALTTLGVVSEAETFYTAVPVPTVSIATAGAGTPVTNITVTPPDAKSGYDIMVSNVDGSFEALYVGVPSTPDTYQSVAGTCGRADRYVVRARRPGWPDGLEWSAAVVLDIVNPCVIAP